MARSAYDIVIIGDLRLPGATARAIAEEVRAQAKAGYRTADLLAGGKTDGVKKVGTQEMGDAIVKELDRLA